MYGLGSLGILYPEIPSSTLLEKLLVRGLTLGDHTYGEVPLIGWSVLRLIEIGDALLDGFAFHFRPIDR